MKIENFTLKPLHNKREGIGLGYILSVLHCSDTDDLVRQISNLFYVANIIDYDTLKQNEYVITPKFLLDIVFELLANKSGIKKSVIREFIGLDDKGTFNKYFDDILEAHNLSVKRVFTFHQIFLILKSWKGLGKDGRSEFYMKKEAAAYLTDGDYEKLELLMTNNGIATKEYIKNDYLKPSDVEKHLVDNDELSYDSNISYLYFFFNLLIMSSIEDKKYNDTSVSGIFKEITESKVNFN